MQEKSLLFSIPKEILQLIVRRVEWDRNAIRALLSTCSRFFRMYTLEERYILYTGYPSKLHPVIDGKTRCCNCGLYVKNERHHSHIQRCVVKVIANMGNMRRLGVIDCISNCQRVQLRVRLPWDNIRVSCPFFKCIYCAGPIHTSDKRIKHYNGCTECKQYVCKLVFCVLCNTTHPRCLFREHDCIKYDMEALSTLIKSGGFYSSVKLVITFSSYIDALCIDTGEWVRFIPMILDLVWAKEYVQFFKKPPRNMENHYVDIGKLRRGEYEYLHDLFIRL